MCRCAEQNRATPISNRLAPPSRRARRAMGVPPRPHPMIHLFFSSNIALIPPPGAALWSPHGGVVSSNFRRLKFQLQAPEVGRPPPRPGRASMAKPARRGPGRGASRRPSTCEGGAPPSLSRSARSPRAPSRRATFSRSGRVALPRALGYDSRTKKSRGERPETARNGEEPRCSTVYTSTTFGRS